MHQLIGGQPREWHSRGCGCIVRCFCLRLRSLLLSTRRCWLGTCSAASCTNEGVSHLSRLMSQAHMLAIPRPKGWCIVRPTACSDGGKGYPAAGLAVGRRLVPLDGALRISVQCAWTIRRTVRWTASSLKNWDQTRHGPRPFRSDTATKKNTHIRIDGPGEWSHSQQAVCGGEVTDSQFVAQQLGDGECVRVSFVVYSSHQSEHAQSN